MTSWSRATQSEDRKMPDEMAGAAGSADGEVSSQTPAPVKPQQTETPDPVFARLFEWRDEALADVRKGLERLDAGTASKAPARRGESMIPLVVGAALSVCGLLTWTMAARSFVRGIRFGLESYIGSSNAGRGMAETILGFLGVTLGWLLVRKRMSRGLMQRMFFVALAIALVLGIIRGSSE